MTMNIFKATIAALTMITLGGCVNETVVEADFGNSVRQMVQSQQAHPEVSNNPNPEVVDGTDAERVVTVLKTYRTDVSSPKAITQEVDINTGG